MLTRRSARGAAGLVLASLAATALAITPASPARADVIRQAQMWVLDAVHAPSAWRVTQGKGVVVAVIDSGVNPHVSDLRGSVTTGPDLTGLNTPRSRSHWGVHGTYMASLIAGHGHAGGSSGILGIAPKAHILSIRVLADPGTPGFRRLQREPGSQAQQALASAIDYAARHGAKVISMSLGNADASQPVRAALQYAYDRGVVVVAAAGNQGTPATARRGGQAPYSFPADYPGVLGVAAVTQSGSVAGFSSGNLSVAVSAPGVDVPAQNPDGHYYGVSGTSPACALTAGVAALVRARYPRLPPALVDQAITTSAQHPAGGYNDRVGFGLVDAAAALAAAGRLLRDRHGGAGVRAPAIFGGGPRAVPPPPHLPPRQPLLWYVAAVLLSFVVTAAAAARLSGRRPVPSRGRRQPPPVTAPRAGAQPRRSTP